MTNGKYVELYKKIVKVLKKARKSDEEARAYALVQIFQQLLTEGKYDQVEQRWFDIASRLLDVDRHVDKEAFQRYYQESQNEVVPSVT